MMLPGSLVKCDDMACSGVRRDSYRVPDYEVDPDKVRLVMVSEVPPEDLDDYFTGPGEPLYLQTTVQAFRDAGFDVSGLDDLCRLGVYLTTAVKCGKTDYAVPTDAIATCSHILERELSLFPSAEVIMLMGDVAIKALSYVAKRTTGTRAVPAGSTYKIRGQELFFGKVRVFPSYLQTGKAYFIEKSKREMIADDIRRAMAVIGQVQAKGDQASDWRDGGHRV